MRIEHFQPAIDWWNNRVEMTEEGFDKSKKYSIDEIVSRSYNMDLCGYPHEEEEILSPQDLIRNYHQKRDSKNAEIDRILDQITAMIEN